MNGGTSYGDDPSASDDLISITARTAGDAGITDANKHRVESGAGNDFIYSEDDSKNYIDGGSDDISLGVDLSTTPLGANFLRGDTVSYYLYAPTKFPEQGVTLTLNDDPTAVTHVRIDGRGDDSLLGIENIIGSTKADIITGNKFANYIYGGDAGDSLVGLGGHDTIYGGGGNDRIFGGAGNDLLSGGNRLDIVEGGAGNDTIYGGWGRDELRGGDDDDLITAVILSGAGSV